MGLPITLYLSYILEFPNNILLKKDSVSKNIFENQYTQVYLCDFHISRPNCISHIFAIVDRIGSLRGWISAASVHYSGNTQQEKTIGSRGIVHDTLRQQCPQEESGHYNYGLTIYAAPFFIQKVLRLQGDAYWRWGEPVHV